MYTYLVGWSKLDKWYYGVKYAGRSGADPKNFWVKYFTSSTVVKEYRNTYGDPDVIQIRKIFESKNKAIDHEHKVLRRMKVIKKDRWLNRHCGRAVKMTEELRAKMRAAQRGNQHNLGREWSSEVKAKISAARTGQKSSPETKAKISAAMRGNQRTRGRPRTPEEKAKISAARLGRKNTPETRAKISIANRAFAEKRRARNDLLERAILENIFEDIFHESN